jgi:hypothetical protein
MLAILRLHVEQVFKQVPRWLSIFPVQSQFFSQTTFRTFQISRSDSGGAGGDIVPRSSWLSRAIRLGRHRFDFALNKQAARVFQTSRLHGSADMATSDVLPHVLGVRSVLIALGGS